MRIFWLLWASRPKKAGVGGDLEWLGVALFSAVTDKRVASVVSRMIFPVVVARSDGVSGR